MQGTGYRPIVKVVRLMDRSTCSVVTTPPKPSALYRLKKRVISIKRKDERQ